MSNPDPLAEYKRQLNQALDAIDDKLQQYHVVQQVAAQAKVRPSYLAVGVAVFAVLFLFYGFGGRLVANLVGFTYPLYESFNSLKRSGNANAAAGDKESDTQWLTYWVVYSTFTLVESFSDFLYKVIPFYHLVKIAFLLWCMLPQFRGALLVYHTVIEPILIKYEGKIDATHSRVKKSVSAIAHDLGEAGEAAFDAKKKEIVDNALNSLSSSRAPGVEEFENEHTKSL